jgi:monothiol glutaredoxin
MIFRGYLKISSHLNGFSYLCSSGYELFLVQCLQSFPKFPLVISEKVAVVHQGWAVMISALRRQFAPLRLVRAFSELSSGPKSESEALELIKKTVSENPLVVFMKGTADRPQCGFSRTVIQILQQYPNLPKFTTVNVLSNEEIRSAIKKYSSWPTIPQLFVKGEFVGGCDIVYEMYKNGSLQKLLEDEKLLE